jgi:group I intron endonuclease
MIHCIWEGKGGDKVVVYKYTNKINGKVYVGITTQKLENRHALHLAKINDGTYFHNALKKYGAENFSLNIIDEAKTLKELREKEKYWIAYYNSYAFDESANGYNLTIGGDGITGYVFSEKDRRKMSKIRRGKKHSKETIVKMKRAQKGDAHWTCRKEYPLTPKVLKLCKDNAKRNLGKRHSEETKAKMSRAHKGRPLSEAAKRKISGANNYNAKSVICLTTGEVFGAISEASKQYGINASNIGECCKGKRMSAGTHPDTGEKMIWRYYDI